MSNLRRGAGKQHRPDAGFTTTEMVASLVIMSFVVVGLMAAARNYARALEALMTATALRAEAPAFESHLISFVGDLDSGTGRRARLMCDTLSIRAYCRDGHGAPNACSIALHKSSDGWSIHRSNGGIGSRPATKPLRVTDLRFVCAFRNGAKAEAVAVFIEQRNGSGRFTPWVAVPL